ncbi:O-antigen ligase family protein [Facklamia sp. DSM 111018]|uniref:O-antigen ligase family protein n=1 Tax=Facklamia lactis TaxID=2749967 RepID=A0ABS0LRW3_9LACT|nr:O-antigen ligase family protein [Facklamia lactis]MBG9980850.1 O-antigen ligase family protein [Facklamia lactis]MBG9986787.1 O-antigen ligase family protein [Facklamia lactis]
MFGYLLLLVMSVFLGSQILAIPTPIAQITIYRVLAIGSLIVLALQIFWKHSEIKLLAKSHATRMLWVYLVWWLIGTITGLWAENISSWIQATFLMTVGISSIVALYFWTQRIQDWVRLIQASWFMMTLLVIWGYLEILTNHYLFADLELLDKYGTFASQPWTRIPITTFANQNDYATMLLAYLAVCMILYTFSRKLSFRLMYLVHYLLAAFLIFQSGSRMSLLCMLIFTVYLSIVSLKIDFTLKQFWWMVSIAGLAMALLLFLLPSIREKIFSIIYFGGPAKALSGDTKRLNIWRNGLLFLVETFGLGVGSGNVEHWAEVRGFWPTNIITNMHNWWLEILVSNGIVAFLLYVWGYYSLMLRLKKISLANGQLAQVAYILLGFLFIFIFASITSANNMLIEWHWVFFGLIIAFIKVIDQSYYLVGNLRYTEEERNEFSNYCK